MFKLGKSRGQQDTGVFKLGKTRDTSIQQKRSIAPVITEEEITADKKENWLFKTLDQINRPQYAVANALYQGIINDEKSGTEIAKNMWKGFTLQEKKSIGDILSEKIQPKSFVGKAATFVGGVALDIATDPLSYVGVGLLNKSGKLVKTGTKVEKFIKAGRAVGKAKKTSTALTFGARLPFTKGFRMVVPGTKKITDVPARSLSKLGQFIRNDAGAVSDLINMTTKVSTRFRPKDVDPVTWQKFLRIKDKAVNKGLFIEQEGIDRAAQVSKLLKEEKLDELQIVDIVESIERGKDVESIAAKQAVMTKNWLSKLWGNTGATAKSVIEEEGYSYLPHLLNEKKAKQIGLGARRFTTKSVSKIKRSLVKLDNQVILDTKTGNLWDQGDIVGRMPMKEVNSLDKTNRATQATIKEINEGFGTELFSQSLPKLLATQAQRTAKVVQGDEFFRNVSKLGVKERNVGSVAKNSGKELFETSAPELKGLFFDESIATHIDETYKKLTNVDEVNQFLKKFDDVQNAWKATATMWNIPFHTRNSISNFWQNSLAGVDNPFDYMKASKMQYKSKYMPNSLSTSEKVLLLEYKKQGLSKVGHLHADLEKTIDREIMSVFDHMTGGKGVVGRAKSVFGGITKVGGSFGEAIEGNAKLTHFIAKRKEGLSAFDAGISVKKYLFDYGDLTPLERTTLKRVVPFYTWTRKNIPLQLGALVSDPARQSKVIKLKNNIEVMTGDDNNRSVLPEWLIDSSPIYLGKKGKVSRYVALDGFFPAADLNKMSEPVKSMLNMISPIIKTPVESALNRNFFFGSEITKEKGWRSWVPRQTLDAMGLPDDFVDKYGGIGERDFLWFAIPGRLEHLASIFRPISEIEKIASKKYQSQDKVDKMLNVALGLKFREVDTSKALKSFDINLRKDEIDAIQSRVSSLKRQIRNNPELRETTIKDIQTLKKILSKRKKTVANQKIEARNEIFNSGSQEER